MMNHQLDCGPIHAQMADDEMGSPIRSESKLKTIGRFTLEAGLIVFLLYSTLLMRQMERASPGYDKGLVENLRDILTLESFSIAVLTGLIGGIILEFLRGRPVSIAATCLICQRMQRQRE